LEKEIKQRLEGGCRSWLVVPEQATVSTERRMAQLLPPSAPLSFEVSNFTRLADSVFRALGGIGVRYATPAARLLTMWRTLGEVAPLLRVPERDRSEGAIQKIIGASKELSASCQSSADLDAAAMALGDGRLSDRLFDLALTLGVYRSLLGESFADGESDLDLLCEKLRATAFFKGAYLAFDSFTGFTEQQYAVLGHLLMQADVTVTLPLPEDAERQLCYEEPKECYARLLALAGRRGVKICETRLAGNRRTLSGSLAFDTEHLWRAEYGDLLYAG
jgi:ATP-dependent helicase/nuclease subunit B